MAPRTSALVEPAVLEWARRSAGMKPEEAARRLSQPIDRLQAWESGTGGPTIAQLRKMADVYKRPLAIFFLDAPPVGFDALRDFRRLPSESAESWTPALNFEIRRAEEQRQSAVELARRLDEAPPTSWRPKAQLQGLNAEDVGIAMREALGVTAVEQISWTEQYRALGGWIRALEDSGTLVIQTERVDLGEMRGFSIYADVYPVIAVNGTDFIRGKVFSLLHEYAHLVLHQSGLCDQISDSQPRTKERDVEVFCNQAAASALMPATDFLSEVLVSQAPSRYEGWMPETLAFLTRRYGVSEEAVLRRLLTLGKTTSRFYSKRREELLRLYEEERRRQKEQQKESNGGPTYYRVKARNLGKGYVRLVSDAYARDAIDTLEAASFLGVKVQHLTKLADEAFGRAG